MVLIELDFTDGEEVHHTTINDVDYRIICNNDYYCLQYKNNNGDYEDYLISPTPNITRKSNDISINLSQGYLDLLGVLGYIDDSVKLQNGDYWSLELSIYQNGKIVKEFEEIITREDGESLVKKMETCSEIIKEANLYNATDDGYDLYALFMKGCVVIFIIAMVLVVIKLLG